MAFDPAELRQILRDSVPDAFLQDTVRCLLLSIEATEEECNEKYSFQEQAHDMRGPMRRINFERDWKKLVEWRYPAASAVFQPNSTSNCYHLEVCFERVVLTASAVESPRTLPRDAEFRKTLARNPQRAFTFGPKPSPPPEGAPLYALLLYGTEDRDPSRAGFAHIVFPDEECAAALVRCDLFARFASSMPELQTAHQVEAISGELPLRARARVGTRAQGDS